MIVTYTGTAEPETLLGAKITDGELQRRDVRPPRSREADSGAGSYFDHKTAAPFIKLEHKQIDSLSGNTPEVWKGSSEALGSQHGDYVFSECHHHLPPIL